MFLQEWNSESLGIPVEEKVIARCGIYGIRPLVCAVYPAKLDKSGFFGYVLDPNFHTKKLSNQAYDACPRPINKDDFADYNGTMTRNLSVQKFELGYFQIFADYWNKNPNSQSKFFEHLTRMYSNRIIYDEETNIK